MKNLKPEKYHSTGWYICMLFLLITVSAICLYFIDHDIYRFVLAAIPLALLLLAKNTVIELHEEYFLIKNQILVVKTKKYRYLYEEVAFVHYHRHAYILKSSFDFWGFYVQKPVEVRYNNQTFESLPVYGARSVLLKGIQSVNDHIYEPAKVRPNTNG